MKADSKSFVLKKRYIILLAIVFFLIGGTSVKLFYDSNNVAVATSVSKTLNIMGSNSPVNIVLDEEIKRIEEERVRAEEELKRIEEEKRIAEEKRIEEEKRIKEEKTKKPEDKKTEGKKIAYLTFDDGPSKTTTPAILDILSHYDIKATFFILGKMVDVNPDILKRTYEEGHSIGHHSYSHKYGHIYKNIENFLSEIKSTEIALKNILGEEFETKLLRLPGGSYEKYKKKFVEAAADLGYKNYDWNALNGDAEGINLSKEKLINRLKATVKGRKEIIILMHDSDSKKSTVEALPEIIDYLISEGYEFRTLD